MAASYTIAGLVSDEELTADYILLMAFDKRIGPVVVAAVTKVARDSGMVRAEWDTSRRSQKILVMILAAWGGVFSELTK